MVQVSGLFGSGGEVGAVRLRPRSSPRWRLRQPLTEALWASVPLGAGRGRAVALGGRPLHVVRPRLAGNALAGVLVGGSRVVVVPWRLGTALAARLSDGVRAVDDAAVDAWRMETDSVVAQRCVGARRLRSTRAAELIVHTGGSIGDVVADVAPGVVFGDTSPGIVDLPAPVATDKQTGWDWLRAALRGEWWAPWGDTFRVGVPRSDVVAIDAHSWLLVSSSPGVAGSALGPDGVVAVSDFGAAPLKSSGAVAARVFLDTNGPDSKSARVVLRSPRLLWPGDEVYLPGASVLTGWPVWAVSSSNMAPDGDAWKGTADLVLPGRLVSPGRK